MNRNLVLFARFVVAATWLYEGLWRKLYKENPEELRVLAKVLARASFAPLNLLRGIGCVEVMLAFGVLAGWSPRFLAGVQILFILALNGTEVALNKGAIADPIGLIVHALPFLVCILFLGQYDNVSKGSSGGSGSGKSAPRSKKAASSV